MRLHRPKMGNSNFCRQIKSLPVFRLHSRSIPRITSCRILLISNCWITLWLNFDSCLYSTGTCYRL